MSTDRSYLAGGLRNVNDSLVADGEPCSVAVAAMLAHNAQLISDTVRPRHLVNQWFPRDAAGQALVSPGTGGVRFGIWGPFLYRPGLELVVHVFGRKDDSTYAANTWLYMFASPDLPDTDLALADYLDEATNYWGPGEIDVTGGCWDLADPHTLDHSQAGEQGGRFYLHGWARADDDTDSECDLRIVSVRERRR